MIAPRASPEYCPIADKGAKILNNVNSMSAQKKPCAMRRAFFAPFETRVVRLKWCYSIYVRLTGG
jgi:hypothetical protein